MPSKEKVHQEQFKQGTIQIKSKINQENSGMDKVKSEANKVESWTSPEVSETKSIQNS